MEDKAAEFIMLMILTTVLSATEIAYSEAVDKTADFLIGVPNAWRLAFAIFSLTINAEFARTFNGSLYRMRRSRQHGGCQRFHSTSFATCGAEGCRKRSRFREVAAARVSKKNRWRSKKNRWPLKCIQ